MEYRVIDAVGEMRWLRTRAKVFADAQGAPALVTGSLTDITTRKRAEEALRESEKRYERAMLAAEAGFWDWYIPSDAFYLSPKLLEMGGFAPGTTFVDRADRKSTRLNSSHQIISYAVFCLKKKKPTPHRPSTHLFPPTPSYYATPLPTL